MARTVAEKMGVTAGCRALLVNAPDDAIDAMQLPPLETPDKGELDYIQLFAPDAAALDDALPGLRDRLAPRGMLWVSWPKTRGLGTDLTLPKVIEIAYRHGLVESKTISVDHVWSAIKLTHPIPGKTYANSFGTLPDR